MCVRQRRGSSGTVEGSALALLALPIPGLLRSPSNKHLKSSVSEITRLLIIQSTGISDSLVPLEETIPGVLTSFNSIRATVVSILEKTKSPACICIDKACSFLSWRRRNSADNAERKRRKMASFRCQAEPLATNVADLAPRSPKRKETPTPPLKKTKSDPPTRHSAPKRRSPAGVGRPPAR